LVAVLVPPFYSSGLNSHEIESLVIGEHARLTKAIQGDDPVWRSDLPGRINFNKLARLANIPVGRLKQLYLASADLIQIKYQVGAGGEIGRGS